MFYSGWHFFGMHALWWVFWLVAIVAVFAVLKPFEAAPPRARETPLEVLQRRYAAGQLTSEEYEERKAKLERDARTT